MSKTSHGHAKESRPKHHRSKEVGGRKNREREKGKLAADVAAPYGYPEEAASTERSIEEGEVARRVSSMEETIRRLEQKERNEACRGAVVSEVDKAVKRLELGTDEMLEVVKSTTTTWKEVSNGVRANCDEAEELKKMMIKIMLAAMAVAILMLCLVKDFRK
ncbi:uncharacterized protein PAC_02339 [Phialocephala subalpina]|uniref:Uncharacterized protein n=1 Tax=Phialocephala subalpina TaxID=576137 RepID=A0A1L7WI59_9HELO|nr:uncharacterized protein PAC_02339 [Phialocephala subalpina]